MQTTCAVLTPRVVWCRARAPAGLAKLSQLLALSPWHFIAHGRSESSSKEQISARAFISEIRAAYRPAAPRTTPRTPPAPPRYSLHSPSRAAARGRCTALGSGLYTADGSASAAAGLGLGT